MSSQQLIEKYNAVRQRTLDICAPLQTEDYVVQPIADVSPPKWHLGHTAWFFETFILQPHLPRYKVFNEQYNFVFNSYYETVGARVVRTDRGNLSRPAVKDIYAYREYVDRHMREFLLQGYDKDLQEVIELGLNHEEQHQELLLTDIKYILGHNPLLPAYDNAFTAYRAEGKDGYVAMPEGVYEIGFNGEGFCFDNELGRHKVYLPAYEISTGLVTNAGYREFIEAGGYADFRHWHAEGWDWVKRTGAQAPLYWYKLEEGWYYYTLQGLKRVHDKSPVCHVNYYEASAYAAWRGLRLPTEAEWEAASNNFDWGQRWEWTNSAYLAYPGFKTQEGAIGEYNGKFMVNQMVLRGASAATAPGHSRRTYRNFFHPHLSWQFTGIRLAR